MKGLTWSCGELGRAHGVTVTCTADGDFGAATPDAALCIYRIAQEALRNVIAHAGANRADVEAPPDGILDNLETNGWELYDVAEDPSECNNLAAKHPDKLRELVSLWWAEAGKYKVLPIDGSVFERSVAERPQLTKERSQYVFYPDLSIVPIGTAPKLFNRPHSITADVTIPDGGAEGVLLAQGGVSGGFVLYVKDGKLQYVHNYMGLHEYRVVSSKEIPKGRAKLRYEFEPTGKPDLVNGKGAAGRGQPYVDGKAGG